MTMSTSLVTVSLPPRSHFLIYLNTAHSGYILDLIWVINGYFFMQVIANGILDLLVSQNGTKTIGLLFCLRKIIIDTEFPLFLVA